MGDRYFLTVNCPYCGYAEDDYWYAPTCGVDDFHCPQCKKISFMYSFVLIKAEDLKGEDLANEFLGALNMWSPSATERINILKDMRKRINKARLNNKKHV